ncbi:MAG: histidine phosphatase family protein [Frankiales bacterium]|nr:histidine phosphatase family protein [Frankiales bacterium]
MLAKTWPDGLWVVRHGESSGNVARDRAEAEELERIDIAERDMDVPLSPLGERQAAALGTWLSEQDDRPTVLWTSPYVRAQETARIALEAAGLQLPLRVDERLREREFGVLDGLTRKGITTLFPDESERRTRLGKFYHRPPGGESWSDVALRLRAVIDEMRAHCQGERVLLVAHQVVVLLVRYIVEDMGEKDILAIDRAAEVANCSVTSYTFRDGLPTLTRYNEAAPLEEQHETVTTEPDVPRAPR